MFVFIYVDDMVVTGENALSLQRFVEKLHKLFALKGLGPLHLFLGIEVIKDDIGMYLTQTRYIEELLKRTNMGNSTTCSTPVVIGKHLNALDGDLMENPTTYKSVIGALQYITHTRPDLSFIINRLS
ncbi:hypothetical protein UlMin_024225 [Ulmus minor]